LLTIASTGVNTTFNGTDIGVRLDVTSDGIELDGSMFREYCNFEKTAATNSYGSGGNTFLDSLIIEHSGAGGYMLTGANNPDAFEDFISITSSGTGYCYFAYGADGTYFQDEVEINDTCSSLGIRFGANAGASTMTVGNTITIGSGGFSSGELELREFSQEGNAAISLTITSTAFIDIYDSDFGGAFEASAARIFTRGSNYAGVTSLTKTGAGSDASAGGNRFLANASITNDGSGYIIIGNGTPDTFDLDLDW
jgi:hypothetical protein